MATPISYLALAAGTPVHAASGAALGTVDRVLQDDALDLFGGIVVTTTAGSRFVDAALVGAITDESVATSVGDDDPAHLPRPDGTTEYDVDPADLDPGDRPVRGDDTGDGTPVSA